MTTKTLYKFLNGSFFSFLLSIVYLWPLRLVSPIADDLHLLAQGSGLLRRKGLLHVVDVWSDLSITSAHLTPLGGVWTAVHVWLTNQMALRTALQLDSAWGLLRIIWIAIAIQSALHLARTLAKALSLPSTFNFLVLPILLGTIQVHGYWSNDPVIAFPVASWAICAIGFLFLSLLIRSVNSTIWPSRYHRLAAILLAFIGVLTYELFLAFLIAGFCLLILPLVSSKKWNIRVYLITLFGVILPSLLLVVAQLIRMSKGSVYSGTEIAIGTSSLPKIAFFALLSSLPFANFQLTEQLLQHGRVVKSQLFWSSSVLIFLAASLLLQAKKSIRSAKRSELFFTTTALIGVWVVSTVLIVLTPKYQEELNGVLGKVYVNYAPSWIALALIISIFLSIFLENIRPFVSRTAITFLLLLGVFQFSTNLRQIYVLQRDSSWSKPLLSLLESSISENVARCNQVDVLFGLPWPEYYQNEIYEGIQDSYQGTYGVPYCDFDLLEGRSALTMRVLSGLYPIEFLPAGRNVFWSNLNTVRFDVFYRGSSNFDGKVEIKISPPPCPVSRKVEVSIDGQDAKTFTLDSESISVFFPVALIPNQRIEVSIQQSGTVCTISSDPRSFMTMVDFPMLTKAEK
jgi:hypothetical protein